MTKKVKVASSPGHSAFAPRLQAVCCTDQPLPERPKDLPKSSIAAPVTIWARAGQALVTASVNASDRAMKGKSIEVVIVFPG